MVRCMFGYVERKESYCEVVSTSGAEVSRLSKMTGKASVLANAGWLPQQPAVWMAVPPQVTHGGTETFLSNLCQGRVTSKRFLRVGRLRMKGVLRMGHMEK